MSKVNAGISDINDIGETGIVLDNDHVSLSGPGKDESAHLLIADKNSNLEKEPQF